MNAKDFRNVILFLCNKWSKDEANLIFNTNGSKFDYENGSTHLESIYGTSGFMGVKFIMEV